VDVDWSTLDAGMKLEIVKLAPDGSVAARYPGVVMAFDAAANWLTVRAKWRLHEIETGGLRFIPGDELHEYFSPAYGFNVFSIFSPEGELRGWYANVTHPTRIEFETTPPMLSWHDLYVDLIVLPDGRRVVRDEDELKASGFEAKDPALHALILKTRDELIALASASAFPFHER